MSEPATATPTAPVTPAETAARLAAEAPRTTTGAIDVHAFAKQAQAALTAERATLDAPSEPAQAAQESAAAEKAEKGKAAKDPKTGKFVPKPGEAAAKPAEATAEGKEGEQAATEEGEQQEEAIPDDRDISLAAWRRKFSQDPVKAVELLAGKKLAEVSVPSKAFAAIREERRAVAKREAAVQQLVNTTVQRYGKFDAAQKAWEAGDVEGAVKAAFGVGVADIGKRHIAHVSGQAPASPEVQALKQQVEQLNQQLQQRSQQEQQAAQQRNAQEQLGNLRTMLASSEDPRIAAVAARPAFEKAVIEHLRANYDETTRTSIPIAQAAELAYDDVYGDWDPPAAASSAQKASTTAPAASKAARPPAKAGRTLDTTRAAEPAPAVRPAPGSRALMEHHIALAQRGIAEERANGG